MHYLYILSSGEFTKIGVTENFQNRFSSYRRHNPGISKVKVYHCDTPSTALQVERFVVDNLKKFSVGYAKEWFNCPSLHVIDCIQELLKKDSNLELSDGKNIKHLNAPHQPVKPRLSFHERLEQLPDLFSINGMARQFSMDKSVASDFIKKWKKKGFVESFGFRTSWYFNVYKNKDAKNEKWYYAMQQVYPEAVSAGVGILTQAGWMTQIHSQEETIIRNRDSYCKIEEIKFMPRSIYWFRRFHDGIFYEGPKRSLLPEYALVDLCENEKYIPDPDDLYLEDEDIVKIKDTFSKLKVEIPQKLWDVLEYRPPIHIPKKRAKI